MRVPLGRQIFINVINRINVFLNLAALLTWKLRCTQFGKHLSWMLPSNTHLEAEINIYFSVYSSQCVSR